MLDWNYSDDFQAVRFQPPDPYENRRDDGIQT
jgi:hypothetical protein